jgi:hypothetical protein
MAWAYWSKKVGGVESLSYSTFGTFTGTLQYRGMTYSPTTQKMYCAPRNASGILIIDPSDDTTSVIGSITGYYGCAYCPDGSANGAVYFCPFDALQVAKLDLNTNTVSLIGTSFADTQKWGGIVPHPNGKLYCFPYARSQYLEINPSTDTTSLVGPVISDTTVRYFGGVVGNDDMIYPSLSNAINVNYFDPILGTVTNFGATISGVLKYDGGFLEGDYIYLTPRNANNFVKIDTVGKTYTILSGIVNPIGDGTNTSRFSGGVQSPNNKFYLVPGLPSGIMEFDTDSDTFIFPVSLTGLPQPAGFKYYGSKIAPNNCIYAAPESSGNILKVKGFSGTLDYNDVYPDTIANGFPSKWQRTTF